MLKATFSSTTMYYGIGPNSDKSIVAEVTIATPEGVYYGSWNLSGHRKGETLTADSCVWARTCAEGCIEGF
ncbi:StfH/YfcO family fimbrial adhesin [Salmonella enterica subsp. enterica serovar Infantis]